MELALHANATTTPKIRSYIQRSKKPAAELAGELGVSAGVAPYIVAPSTHGANSAPPKSKLSLLVG